MTHLILYNPASGDGTSPCRALALEHRWRRLGVHAQAIPTTGPWTAAEQILTAHQQTPLQRVIVCGGDGTLLEALQSAVPAVVPLGVLPTGTGNVLARDLGFSSDPARATEQLLSATPHSFPLAQIQLTDRSLYLAASTGVGLHADLMLQAKVAGRGRSQYYLQGLRHILTAGKHHQFAVSATLATGEPLNITCSELLCTRVRSYGGLLSRWNPGSRLDLPCFNVTWADQHHRGRVFFFLARALAGMPTTSVEGVGSALATKLTCVPDHPDSPVQVDGTVVGQGSFSIHIAKEHIQLLVP